MRYFNPHWNPGLNRSCKFGLLPWNAPSDVFEAIAGLTNREGCGRISGLSDANQKSSQVASIRWVE